MKKLTLPPSYDRQKLVEGQILVVGGAGFDVLQFKELK